MRLKKYSIRDVAGLAGVSTTTVSHVINNTRFVSEEAKHKVFEAIKRLEYYPSSTARGLASNQSKIIGVVFSDISNPFFTAVFQGIEKVLTERGYEVMLANTGEVELTQTKVLSTMLSRQIDGLIIAPTGNQSNIMDDIIASDIPVVMIDRGGPYLGASIIHIDNEEAAYQATGHLIADGHQKIGIVVGLDSLDTTVARVKGYKKALLEHQMVFEDRMVLKGESRIAHAYISVKTLMKAEDPPTAIFSTNNLMTLGALQAFRDLGLNCPQQIGLISFDDHEWADIFSPPLTVIKQPTYDMGTLAAQKILTMIHSTISQQPFDETMTAHLVVRGSCSIKCHQIFNTSSSRIDLERW